MRRLGQIAAGQIWVKNFMLLYSDTHDIIFITKMVQNLGKHVFVSRANRDTLGEGKKELSATNRSPKQTNPSMLQQSFQTGYGAAL